MANLYAYSQRKADAGSLPASCWKGSHEAEKPAREREFKYLLQQPAISDSTNEEDSSSNNPYDIDHSARSAEIRHLFASGLVHRTTSHLRQQ